MKHVLTSPQRERERGDMPKGLPALRSGIYRLYSDQIRLKGPITLEPPYNFSEPYQSGIAIAD